MKIRLASKKDVLAVGKYLIEMWLMHSDKEPEFISRKIIENYDEKTIIKYLQSCFNKSGRSFLFIAEENGEIIGILKANIEKIQNFFNQPKVFYLDDIYVKGEYRGRGVALSLIKEAERLAKKKKIKWLKSRIYEFNKGAQEMAKSAGLRSLYSEYFKILT